MINPNFAIIGGLLPVVGGIHYAIDTVKGKTKPNRVSWTIWSLAPLVAFGAQLAQNVSLKIAFLTFAIGLANLVVVAASFASPHAYWKLTRFDVVCGGVAMLALLLWAVAGQGNLAIVCCILADLAATIPTVKKLYVHPESERGIVYVTGIVGAGLTLLTVQVWNFANVGYPLYYLLSDIVIFIVILLPGRQQFVPLLSKLDEPASNTPAAYPHVVSPTEVNDQQSGRKLL